MEIRCKQCGELKDHKAKGLCEYCYKKYLWKPKQIICKRCGREMPSQAKGLCRGCYNFVFHLDKNKAWNHKKLYGLDMETYRKITKSCVICGFDKAVDLHHLDENRENGSESNLIGLCPNHHKMLHDFRYREEIFSLLREKGIVVPKDIKIGYKQPV